MSHTPGPWLDELEPYLDSAYAVAKGEDKWKYPPRRIEDEEVIANARLMFAAPQLLEALKDSADALANIINAANNGFPYSPTELVKLFADIRCRADAAYEKATGEKS